MSNKQDPSVRRKGLDQHEYERIAQRMRDDRPTEKKVPRRTPQRAHNSYITDATAVREDLHQATCIHKKEAEEGEENRS